MAHVGEEPALGLGRFHRPIPGQLDGPEQVGQLGLVVLALGDIELDAADCDDRAGDVLDGELH